MSIASAYAAVSAADSSVNPLDLSELLLVVAQLPQATRLARLAAAAPSIVARMWTIASTTSPTLLSGLPVLAPCALPPPPPPPTLPMPPPTLPPPRLADRVWLPTAPPSLPLPREPATDTAQGVLPLMRRSLLRASESAGDSGVSDGPRSAARRPAADGSGEKTGRSPPPRIGTGGWACEALPPSVPRRR